MQSIERSPSNLVLWGWVGKRPLKGYNTHNLKNTRNQKFLTFSIIILFWILKKFNHNQCEKKLISIYNGYNSLILQEEVCTTDLRCTH